MNSPRLIKPHKSLSRSRSTSYIDHVCHIQNIPNPNQTHYLNYTHSIVWSFSHEKKLQPDKDDPLFTPGPTRYELKDTTSRSPSWLIGRAKRELSKVDSMTPGSGRYEYQSFIGETPKYSIPGTFQSDNPPSQKLKNHIKNNSEIGELRGPGYYNSKDNSTPGPKYTIGLKRPKILLGSPDKYKSPSVGDYELRKDKDLVKPCYKFDQEKREDISLNPKAFGFPGPNKYTIKLDKTSTSTPKWSFSKSIRFPYQMPVNKHIVRLNVPGPGRYRTSEYTGREGPRFTFKKDKFNHSDAADESMQKTTINYPSPVSYHPDITYRRDSPEYTISKTVRPPPEDSNKAQLLTPTSVKYDPDKEKASYFPKPPAFTIMKANRDEDMKVPGSKKIRLVLPGPGSYQIENGLIPQGPHYSMRDVKKIEKIEEKPGPGAYDVGMVDKGNEPKYSIGKEERGDELKLVKKNAYPGPGSYEAKNVRDIIVSFPLSKRGEMKIYDYPGPGQYKIPTAFDNINGLSRQGATFDVRYKFV